MNLLIVFFTHEPIPFFKKMRLDDLLMIPSSDGILKSQFCQKNKAYNITVLHCGIAFILGSDFLKNLKSMLNIYDAACESSNTNSLICVLRLTFLFCLAGLLLYCPSNFLLLHSSRCGIQLGMLGSEIKRFCLKRDNTGIY